MIKNHTVHSFAEMVEVVANQVSSLQSNLSTIEKGLLALKNDNNCANNTKVMLAATELQVKMNAFFHNLHEVGRAHHDTAHSHTQEDSEQGEDAITDDMIHDLLMTLFFGGRNGKPN